MYFYSFCQSNFYQFLVVAFSLRFNTKQAKKCVTIHLEQESAFFKIFFSKFQHLELVCMVIYTLEYMYYTVSTYLPSLEIKDFYRDPLV